MPMLKLDQAQLNELTTNLKAAIAQAILKTYGPEHTIRVLTANVDVAPLTPVGQNVAVKMSIDVYPKD